jgi:predicted nucleic acid-binding protein
MARYLADTSIWAWANRPERGDIREKLAARVERDQVVVCAPVMLETMHRARTGDAYEQIHAHLFGALDRLPLSDKAAERALVVQREMAQTKHGNHLRPATDYLIAAVAETAEEEVILWAFDRDLRVIAVHTGQPYEGERSTGSGH